MSRTLEVLLHHMRITAATGTPWEAGFARSVIKQSRKPSWRPSKKQRAVMERLVSEALNEDELEVIED
ncbi:MAG: hypothetical protein ACU0GG_21625 [Paracoccaceae bacterium]